MQPSLGMPVTSPDECRVTTPFCGDSPRNGDNMPDLIKDLLELADLAEQGHIDLEEAAAERAYTRDPARRDELDRQLNEHSFEEESEFPEEDEEECFAYDGSTLGWI